MCGPLFDRNDLTALFILNKHVCREHYCSKRPLYICKYLKLKGQNFRSESWIINLRIKITENQFSIIKYANGTSLFSAAYRGQSSERPCAPAVLPAGRTATALQRAATAYAAPILPASPALRIPGGTSGLLAAAKRSDRDHSAERHLLRRRSGGAGTGWTAEICDTQSMLCHWCASQFSRTILLQFKSWNMKRKI